jgi:PleD family two-component response regulator
MHVAEHKMPAGLTAAAREQGRVFKGYDAGAVDFIYKPIEGWASVCTSSIRSSRRTAAASR